MILKIFITLLLFRLKMTEEKENTLVFKNNIGKEEIYVEYVIKNQEAHMERTYFPEYYIKAYILLLSESIKELEKKNIKYLVQRITIEDWESNISKIEEWKQKKYLINEEKNTVVIYCDIDIAMVAILKAFGFNV